MNIKLISKKSSKPGELYWYIYLDEIRCGHVYINPGDKPSINIKINQKTRGQGIGSIAYRLAVQESGYSKVYAYMRKNNIASQKAASKAGFKVIQDPDNKQLTMIWEK